MTAIMCLQQQTVT